MLHQVMVFFEVCIIKVWIEKQLAASHHIAMNSRDRLGEFKKLNNKK